MSLAATESSGASGSGEIKPSRGWYGVAVAIVVGSLIAAFFLSRSAFDTLSLSVEPIAADGTIEVHDRQLSVFAPSHLSAPESISCTVTPPGGGQPASLDGQLDDVSINSQVQVGTVPDDLPAGTYRLRCTDGDTVLSLDGFGTQTTEGWGRAILEVVLAIIIVGMAGLTAITIVVITAVRRSSARNRRRRPPSAPYGSAGFPSAPTPMP